MSNVLKTTNNLTEFLIQLHSFETSHNESTHRYKQDGTEMSHRYLQEKVVEQKLLLK